MKLVKWKQTFQDLDFFFSKVFLSCENFTRTHHLIEHSIGAHSRSIILLHALVSRCVFCIKFVESYCNYGSKWKQIKRDTEYLVHVNRVGGFFQKLAVQLLLSFPITSFLILLFQKMQYWIKYMWHIVSYKYSLYLINATGSCTKWQSYSHKFVTNYLFFSVMELEPTSW